MAKNQLASIVLLVLAATTSVYGAQINVRNQCSYVISACDQAGSGPVTCYALQNGQAHLLDVGASWSGGLIWGFPSDNPDTNQGNLAKPQANLAEFTITSPQDSYDLSNVNAYNLPLAINPTSIADGSAPSGTHCGSPSCTINDLNSFCQAPNTLTGAPGNGCRNTDGTGTVATSGTMAFKNACPTSYSYSQDDQNQPGVVFGCPNGSNYEVVFCP